MTRGYRGVPGTGPERERLREKGQFWTPDWVADAMVAYAAEGDDVVFDPAAGTGAFLLAVKRLSSLGEKHLRFAGAEIDPDALTQARESGLSSSDLKSIEVRDFLLDPPARQFKAIVANPPYIRHHRVAPHTKLILSRFAGEVLGHRLDGRAGLHVYFLLRALQLLDAEGRLAFILPADTFEGVFAGRLWQWIASRFRIDVVITFAPEASPFPGVDTNAVVVMIQNRPPGDRFIWACCREAPNENLKAWVAGGACECETRALSAHLRSLSEGLATGFSRPPFPQTDVKATLGDYASVMRGIVTGANDYFFLTTERARELAIPDELLVRAVGRTRDVPGHVLDDSTIRELERRGRPTLLFRPDGRPATSFCAAVRSYLKTGEEKGIHLGPLIRTRRPWYKMELRKPPPILFAYLGRRNARFIRNEAGVVPLTSFLCVYPHHPGREFEQALWEVLTHPDTVANLRMVGKSYGSGAIKVEPRALERLALPACVVTESLTPPGRHPLLPMQS